MAGNFRQRSVFRPGYPFYDCHRSDNYIKNARAPEAKVCMEISFDNLGNFIIYLSGLRLHYKLTYSKVKDTLELEQIPDKFFSFKDQNEKLLDALYCSVRKNLIFCKRLVCQKNEFEVYDVDTAELIYKIPLLEFQNVVLNYKFIAHHDKLLIAYKKEGIKVYSLEDGQYLFDIQHTEEIDMLTNIIRIDENLKRVYIIDYQKNSFIVYSWVNGSYLFSFRLPHDDINDNIDNPKKRISHIERQIDNVIIDREGRLILPGLLRLRDRIIVLDPMGNYLHSFTLASTHFQIALNYLNGDIAIKFEDEILMIRGDFWESFFKDWSISLFKYCSTNCQRAIFTLTAIRTHCWESIFSLFPNELLFLIFREIWDMPATKTFQ